VPGGLPTVGSSPVLPPGGDTWQFCRRSRCSADLPPVEMRGGSAAGGDARPGISTWPQIGPPRTRVCTRRPAARGQFRPWLEDTTTTCVLCLRRSRR